MRDLTTNLISIVLFPQVFQDLDFSLMEMNPFTLDAASSPFPLDMRCDSFANL